LSLFFAKNPLPCVHCKLKFCINKKLLKYPCYSTQSFITGSKLLVGTSSSHYCHHHKPVGIQYVREGFDQLTEVNERRNHFREIQTFVVINDIKIWCHHQWCSLHSHNPAGAGYKYYYMWLCYMFYILL